MGSDIIEYFNRNKIGCSIFIGLVLSSGILVRKIVEHCFVYILYNILKLYPNRNLYTIAFSPKIV